MIPVLTSHILGPVRLKGEGVFKSKCKIHRLPNIHPDKTRQRTRGYEIHKVTGFNEKKIK